MQDTFYIGRPLWERYLLWLGIMQPEVGEEQQLTLTSKVFMPDKPHDERFAAWEKLSKKEKDDFRKSGDPAPKRGLIFGDFGRSVARPTVRVADKILEALPVTIAINLIVYFILYVVSIPLGIFSATHHNATSDKIVTVLLFVLYSLPGFWVAVLLMKCMVVLKQHDYPYLPFQGLWPTGAEEMPTLKLLWECTLRLFLPVLASSYAGLASLSRYMRVGMLDIIRSDYIRTARAKGCSDHVVVYRHALRNSLIPIITIAAGLLPGLYRRQHHY